MRHAAPSCPDLMAGGAMQIEANGIRLEYETHGPLDGPALILIRGLGLESVWPAVGMLSLYAVGFFLLAVWRFRKMEA